ncbi:MAG: hypothetical protein R3E79_39780 [Caldilineaceae bacterium]
MTQQRIAIDYLRDMAESISNALEFVTGMSFDDFQHDIKHSLRLYVRLKSSEKQPNPFLTICAKSIPIFPGVAWQGCVTN